MAALYDSPADVVRKALRGLELSPGQLAESTAIDLALLQDFLAGVETETALVTAIAAALELDAGALLQLENYQPGFPDFPQVSRWSLPFGDDEVNVWRVSSGETHLLFDAGFRPSDLSARLAADGLPKVQVLITHPHRDHIGGLSGIKDRIDGLYCPTPLENATLAKPDDEFTLGPFTIRVIDLAGHHPSAVGYRVSGLAGPLCVAGDAIYAGTIGFCPDFAAFSNARRSIEAEILTLAGETLILPGHGPPSTLAQERRSNPFLAAWQRQLSAGA